MAGIDAIVDTGFVVGALDAADQWHAWAAREFPGIRSPALTCEAVISEAFVHHADTKRGAAGPHPCGFRPWSAAGIQDRLAAEASCGDSRPIRRTHCDRDRTSRSLRRLGAG